MPRGRKKKSNEQVQISFVDNDTIVITSEQYEKKLLQEAVKKYESEGLKSVYLNEQLTTPLVNFTIADIDNLAFNAQSDLNKILKINSIVRYFVNKNDIIGKVYEAIESNINAKWKLIFPKFKNNDDANVDEDTIEDVKYIIDDFNQKINLKNLITDCISLTFLEGNYPMYLRKDVKNKKYQVDYYHLGVVEVSDYEENGEPYLLLNIMELKNRLNKIYKKNKKNQYLFYKNMDEEVENTFPEEVFKAYKNNEQYAKLDINNTGIIRINNMHRKYGLSPIFKALKPAIRLENIELSDDRNTLVRGKKIIFQKLSKELFVNDKSNIKISWAEAQAKAHIDLMKALSQEGIVVYTGLPWSESVEYIEPKLEQTNVQIKKAYENKIMTALGISYLSADKGSFGAATISIKELMKLINHISSQLENILYKWYKGILKDHGIDPKYTPTISVIDSEQLENDIKLKLVEVLFNKLNCSYETAYELLGINVKDEYRRRKYEQENNYDEIFVPHLTSYNSSNKGGRPSSQQDLDRLEYDKDYNKQVRVD